MKSNKVIGLIGTILLLGLGGCGGGYSTALHQPFPAPSPSPSPGQTVTPAVISSISPASAKAGGSWFTLQVTGQYFSEVRKFPDQGNYVVLFGATPLKTTFVSDTELTAVVPAASIATTGTVLVSAQTTDLYTNTVPFNIISSDAVSVVPTSDSLGPNGVRQFSTGVPNSQSSVTWGIQETPGGGSITDTGFYTAPSTPGIFHVVATSKANPSERAIATVTVLKSGFSPTGSMHTARDGHSATLLADGTVLIVGSDGSAELFDPTTGSFSVTGSMDTSRYGATYTELMDGRVLVAGGFGPGASMLPRLATAELYDPHTGKFTLTGNMTDPRVLHTATLLKDGRVLIAGGTDKSDGGGAASASAELFDPSTGKFTSTGSMGTDRAQHTATLLKNGKVFITGGWNGHAADAADDPPWDPLFGELFDPSSGTFTSTGSMSTTRIGHTATLLTDGKVLLLGGINNLQNIHGQPANPQYAEIYDPATKICSGFHGLSLTRQEYTVTALKNGELLLVGGKVQGMVVPAAELLDATSSALVVTGGLGTPRIGHSATLLNSGQVLVVGGADNDGNALGSAELYQ